MFTVNYRKIVHVMPHSIQKNTLRALIMVALWPIVAMAQVRERTDRGVVALTVEEGTVYVGWRLLASDPEDVAFNVYRKGIGLGNFEKVNDTPITKSTNCLDTSASPGHGYRYKIKTVHRS